MKPEDIKRLTDAKLKAEHASRNVTSTSIEVKGPVRVRGFELEERYKDQNFNSDARQEVGEALNARVEALMNNLWAQDSLPEIKPTFKYLHKETKIITAEGFVPLHMTQYHDVGPDADPINYPEGHTTLTDTQGFWGLNHNDVVDVMAQINYHHMHAQLEDDINTLEALHTSLKLTLPE